MNHHITPVQPSLFADVQFEEADLVKGDLPSSLEMLLDVLGFDGARSFVAKYGGTSVYVPMSATSKSRLKDEMTEEQFAEFIEVFNPNGEMQCWYTVPKGDRIEQQMRNGAIIRDHNCGLSLNALARKYSLTARHVSNILKRGGYGH